MRSQNKTVQNEHVILRRVSRIQDEFMGANTLQISKNRLRGAYLSDLEDEFLYIKYQCKSERPLHFEQIMKIMNIRIIVKEL